MRSFQLLFVLFFSTFIVGVYFVARSTVFSPASLSAYSQCLYKNIGDADCQNDSSGKPVTLLDYVILKDELVNRCSNSNKAGCGGDSDTNGDIMDANFNFVDSIHAVVDERVDIFDYAIWNIGYLKTSSPTVTVTPTPTTQPQLLETMIESGRYSSTNFGTTKPYVYVWFSEGSRGVTSNTKWAGMTQSDLNVLRNRIKEVQHIPADKGTKMLLVSSYRTLDYILKNMDSELKSAGIVWVGYNMEGPPVATPQDELNAMNSSTKTTNSMALFASIADQYGYNSMFGPIRGNIDAVSNAAVKAMFEGGLDGIAMQEQKYIETESATSRAQAVQKSINRYVSIGGKKLKHASVQIMSSRCGSQPWEKCKQFVGLMRNQYKADLPVTSIAIWSSSPSENAIIGTFAKTVIFSWR